MNAAVPLSDEQEHARVAIYRHFAATGRPPSAETVAAAAQVPLEAVPAVLEELAAARHLALEDGEIVLAHPFATRSFAFSVMGPETLWWGGCAWDAFAIPQLVPGTLSAVVATTCPACGAPHAWVVGRNGPPPGEQVAHFLVPMAEVWSDVIHACGNQRIFCSESCVDRWLEETGHARGSVFTLETLWRLASRWYEGRLDSPYVRREPIAAAAYFRDAGLRGPFWGLSDD